MDPQKAFPETAVAEAAELLRWWFQNGNMIFVQGEQSKLIGYSSSTGSYTTINGRSCS